MVHLLVEEFTDRDVERLGDCDERRQRRVEAGTLGTRQGDGMNADTLRELGQAEAPTFPRSLEAVHESV
jgi:hypothetical protein